MSIAFQRSAVALALVSLSTLASAAAPEARARGQIEAYAGYTMHGAGHAYAVRDVVTDADGSTHVRFDRRVQGMRVIGGDLVVHADRNGSFKSASHTLRHVIDGTGNARVNPAEARRAAQAAHGGDAQDAEQVIYARGAAPALAYDVKVFGEQADGTPSEKHVIVDAFSGAVLETWDDIHTAPAAGTGKSFFSGNVALTTNSISGGYELRDPSRGNQYTVDASVKKGGGGGQIFTDADNIWGNNALSDAATIGVDAQYGTAMTWDYYKNVHGRSGIANDGVGAYNRVHYGRRYNNAYWSDSCFCMTYGDGDGTTFNPFDSLDVAGHEMTHGVTSRSANLTYSGESGGLNESTSDIFGTLVEFYANNSNDAPDYLIGEKLYKSGNSALRTMVQPSKDGASSDCWYSTVGSLDVHYSSGVGNHWFYLLAEGTNSSFGASKTCKAGDTKTATGTASLSGIGRDKAGKIWYRALTVYMTSSTKYAGARAASMSAAADLYGAGSAEQNAVAAAWSAVNVN